MTRLDPEVQRAVRARAGEFTLNLVKALLQTTTYSSDHPLARAATQDLFVLFKDLTENADELTYVLASTVDERGVMVDGILPEPLEVAKTFRGVLGDHFVSKLHDYFVRNRIASFTIKREIDRREFETFLALWSEWSHRAREEALDLARFSDELAQNGILHVTVVGQDELLGAYRHLPWPIKIALTRLRKDISRLPLLREAGPDTLLRLKQQAIVEVVRPLRKLEMVRDLLLNADLVAEGVTITTELEVEDCLVGAVPQRSLHELTVQLMDIVEQVTQRAPSHMHQWAGRDVERFEHNVRRVTRRALQRLGQSDQAEVRSLLHTGFQKGLIPIDELPEDLRRKIRAGETTDRFQAQADAYLKDFDLCTDPKNYLKYLNVMVLVLPELVHRRDARLVGAVFELLARHQDEPVPPFLGRTRFIEETMTQLEHGTFLDDLIRVAASTPREERDPLELAVSRFGPAVVPGLLRCLAATEDPAERKAICTMLVRVGLTGVPLLIDELRSHRHQWSVVRNLLWVLGELHPPEALRAVQEYGQHPNPRVREEAISAIARIGGMGVQDQLIPFLDDKDEIVARRAVHLLAALHCIAPGFLTRVHDAVRLRERSQDEPAEGLQGTCLRALMAYDGVPLPETPDIEKTLLEVVHPPRLKLLLPGRLGLRAKPEEIRGLALDVLGVIGGMRSVPVLEQLANSDATMALRAREALGRVRSKLGS